MTRAGLSKEIMAKQTMLVRLETKSKMLKNELFMLRLLRAVLFSDTAAHTPRKSYPSPD